MSGKNNVPVYEQNPKSKNLGQKVKTEKVEKICNAGKCVLVSDGCPPVQLSKAPVKSDGVAAGAKVGKQIVYHPKKGKLGW